MTSRIPFLMTEENFARMLENISPDEIFLVMGHAIRLMNMSADSSLFEERYNRAKERYIELKLSEEDFDYTNNLEYDLWRCLIEYELVRRYQKERKFRSNYMRKSIKNKGIVDAVSKAVKRGRLTIGKTYLIDNNLPEYSFEKIVLKHQEMFEDNSVVEKAQETLKEYYKNINTYR
jgi:hypothetical protein